MAPKEKPDHRAVWREDAINRIASILFEAEFVGCRPDEVMTAAKRQFERLRQEEQEEMERDRWD